MFKTKKQLKEKIKRLNREIEGLKISKDIAVITATSETRNAKAVANYWKDKFKNSPTAINKHNEFLIKHITSDNSRLDKEIKNLKEALKKEKGWSSIVNAHNDVLNKEIENLNNYIKKLEEKIVKQGQIIQENEEYIAFLQSNFNLNIRTTLQNNQFKDKLNRISAILNED